MASVEPIRRSPGDPIPLESHALDNLRYIRETMERAGSFTAVPGWGGVLMGVTALAAAGFASHAGSRGMWLSIWLGEGVLAIGLGILAMWRKARAAGLPLWSAPARKIRFQFCPAAASGRFDHAGAVARGRHRVDSRGLADAIWHRNHYRRSILGACSPRDGRLFLG